MKGIITYMMVTLMVTMQSLNAQTPAQEVADLLTSMKAYTLAVANAMPENKYEYQPSESAEFRTFSRHMKHIRNFMNFQLMILKGEDLSDIGAIIGEGRAYESKVLPKSKVMSDLSAKFDEVIDFFNNTEDKQLRETYKFFFEANAPVRSKMLTAMALRDHISHHRAQAIVYLRESGITPPGYQRY